MNIIGTVSHLPHILIVCAIIRKYSDMTISRISNLSIYWPSGCIVREIVENLLLLILPLKRTVTWDW